MKLILFWRKNAELFLFRWFKISAILTIALILNRQNMVDFDEKQNKNKQTKNK